VSEKQVTLLPATEGLPQRILVAVDFSEDSRAALIWAYRLAQCKDSELYVLHVVHDPVSNPGFYRRTPEDSMQPMSEVAEKMMEQFLADTAEQHPQLDIHGTVITRFVTGLPPTRIVEVADLLKADLIAIGRRGTTELPHRLQGSTRERVVELAKPPVVVVGTNEPDKPSKKEKKRLEKQLKKERKQLKKALKLQQSQDSEGGDDG
jgi:nucleotide-binding universal stress UspA family protein